MSLSVAAAAAEAGAREALAFEGVRLTFADLAARVGVAARRLAGRAPGPVCAAPEPHPESAIELLALFELGIPAALLHPRLPAAAREELAARRALASDEILAVPFTSGSSGRPRGVELSRRAFVASARASAAVLGWREEDRWLCCLPIAHVGGLSILTRCLLARRTVVLARRFEPARIARLLAEERITLTSLVPTMLSRLLDLDPAWRPPSSLRAVLLGGAAPSPSLLDRARRRGVPVIETYGMTETCSHITLDREPLPGVELEVRAGKLRVRGPMLMNGYAPPDSQPPAIDGEGWFETGDRAEISARGRLSILGRADATIVTGGENVDPAEVERILAAIDGVESACVFAVKDPEWGEVVGAAVVAPGLEPERLRRLARERLAPHQRPRRLALLDELPLLPSGKVDRAAARDATRRSGESAP